MKQYPRIYSLSTLGIRQHQGFDYLFHPFRTDFVGDSGCGKSMIADMLQLVFVGSEAWMSPTEATERRTVDGMVLRTVSRGTDFAYIFLNLEVSHQEYVIIGAYLESSSQNTRAFIIHKNYDEDSLEPLQIPVTKDFFLREKAIMPLDDLKPHLEAQNLVLHTYSRKRFHKVLFENELLLLDLSGNDRLLNDYAAIIQSFSRGKVLEVNKSDSLKGFLFGNFKGRDFARLFRQAEQEMRSTVADYGSNKAEIERIVQKQRSLLDLQQKKSDSDSDQLDWLVSNCRFTNQEVRVQLELLQEAVRSNIVEKQKLDGIHKVILEEIAATENKLETEQRLYDAAKSAYEAQVPNWENLKKAKELQDKLGIPVAQIAGAYVENREMRRRRKLLESVEIKLSKLELESLPMRIDSFDSVLELLDSLQEVRAQYMSDLSEKELFLGFANMRDKDSLGYWALTSGRSLSKVEESMLMHFKSYSIVRPERPAAGSKYISDPEMFLREVGTTSDEDGGFWATFGGLKEFVALVNEQKFLESNLGRMEEVLESIADELTGEIAVLRQGVIKVDMLKQTILGEPNFNEYLGAASDQGQINSFNYIDELEVGEEEIERHVTLLNRSQEIEEGYNQSFKAFDAYGRSLSSIVSYRHQLSREEAKFSSGQVRSQWDDRVDSIVQEVQPSLEFIDDIGPVVAVFRKAINASDDKANYLYDQVEQCKSRLNSLNIFREWEEFKKKGEARDKAWESYRSAYFSEPALPLVEHEFQFDPSEKYRVYMVSKSIFEQSFSATIETFGLLDGYRLKDEFNLLELGRMLLPEAFKGMEVGEEAIISTIESYLKSINEKNRELSKRKLQTIQDLLEQVREEISTSVDFARRIDLFLNSPESEITGGNRARLKLDFSRQFPKAWIDTFTEKLQNEGTLFQVAITDQLADSVSLQEKLFHAFQICGGPNTVNSLEKLLDPNSYIDLTFVMESSASGRSNKGSTGQTYAAVALLCIARMSLINWDSGSKHQKGIKFMPIDEAEGLGSNYDMLYSIARKFDYQIISMSINPLGRFIDGDQYLYMLHKNTETELDVNNKPYVVLQVKGLPENSL